jgi:hypothetical protein
MSRAGRARLGSLRYSASRSFARTRCDSGTGSSPGACVFASTCLAGYSGWAPAGSWSSANSPETEYHGVAGGPAPGRDRVDLGPSGPRRHARHAGHRRDGGQVVSQGTHPGGHGRLRAGAPARRTSHGAAVHGIFLDRTRRMHPDVCRLINALCRHRCTKRKIESPTQAELYVQARATTRSARPRLTGSRMQPVMFTIRRIDA